MTITRDSLRRAIRTFMVAFVGLFFPGLFGWLNDLTEWAKGEGSTPFPDAHGLLFLLVAAITAAVIAVLNLVWNAIEDSLGKGILRSPARSTTADRSRNEAGAVRLPHVGASRDRALPGKRRIRARRHSG